VKAPDITGASGGKTMDVDLVIRAQHGDKEAYGLIVTEIADRLLAVARRILRDIDIAEDATQQALLSPSSWLVAGLG
jgi:hypothetical protein